MVVKSAGNSFADVFSDALRKCRLRPASRMIPGACQAPKILPTLMKRREKCRKSLPALLTSWHFFRRLWNAGNIPDTWQASAIIRDNGLRRHLLPTFYKRRDYCRPFINAGKSVVNFTCFYKHKKMPKNLLTIVERKKNRWKCCRHFVSAENYAT